MFIFLPILQPLGVRCWSCHILCPTLATPFSVYVLPVTHQYWHFYNLCPVKAINVIHTNYVAC